jgi:hypothetical protein
MMMRHVPVVISLQLLLCFVSSLSSSFAFVFPTSNLQYTLKQQQQQQRHLLHYQERHRQRRPVSLSKLVLTVPTPTATNTGTGRATTLYESMSDTSRTFTSDDKNNDRKLLYPSVGDIVRYYDLDGGNAKGQILIGKISYISKNLGNEKSGWTVEVVPLDNVDDSKAYYTDYPNYQTRKAKTTVRDLLDISPVASVFVNSENAYKISIDRNTNLPIVRQERYDIVGYNGPFGTVGMNSNIKPINTNIVLEDALRYDELKFQLLRNSAIFGIFGAIAIDLFSGSTERAIIFLCGVIANIGYLYFLSMKIDTLATTQNNKFGKLITNLRFVIPVIPFIGVAYYNELFHTNDGTIEQSMLKLITTQQFFDLTLGFLSYRIPLFFTQIQESLSSNDNESSSSSKITEGYERLSKMSSPKASKTSTTTGTITPGKVSLSSTMENDVSTSSSQPTTSTTSNTDTQWMKPLFPTKSNQKNDIVTIFLISGPSNTGRSQLVQRFVKESNGRFVLPNYMDRYDDTAQFEWLDERNGFIYIDPTDRYGITRESLIRDVQNLSPNSVLVIDADVDFALQLSKMGGIRLVAVWVTLDNIDAFEDRVRKVFDQESNRYGIPQIMSFDEGRNIEIRARTMKIVQEIELGISSGIFEFTIINDNEEQSLKELRDASKYCFV